jgi:hypothetical protein
MSQPSDARIPFLYPLMVACLFTIFAGCGGGSAPDPATTTKVTTAITAYLAEQSMEMKVAEVSDFTATGENATATASLQQADGVYNVKVAWTFQLAKSGEGWKVTSHAESK